MAVKAGRTRFQENKNVKQKKQQLSLITKCRAAGILLSESILHPTSTSRIYVDRDTQEIRVERSK